MPAAAAEGAYAMQESPFSAWREGTARSDSGEGLDKRKSRVRGTCLLLSWH